MNNNMTVAHSSTSIFFSVEKSKKQLALEGLMAAKLELIASIFKIRGFGGFVPSGEDFDALLDLDIDLLHMEVIKAEDWAYGVKGKKQA